MGGESHGGGMETNKGKGMKTCGFTEEQWGVVS